MQVAWINETAGPFGGCERYVLDTTRLLAERGFRSTLFYDPRRGTDGRYLDTFDAAFPLVESSAQLEAAAPDLFYLHRWSDPSIVEELVATGVPALRFFHDHQLFCLREHKYTTLRKRTCGRSVGLGCYGCLGFINRSDSWPGVRFARVGSLLDEQALNRQLDGFVVASDYMVEHLRAHGFERRKIHKIPLFAEPAARESAVERERDLFLFVGALTTGKGLDVLLEAMSRMRGQARLVVAGAGPQGDEYRRKAKRLGLESRVEFAGSLSRRAVSRLYRRALALVLPARAPETFALVGPEAMSHSAAVVATEAGGVGEWLVDELNGLLVPPGSAVLLGEALDRLLADAETALRMGEQGALLHNARFLPSRHADSLAGVMQELVS